MDRQKVKIVLLKNACFSNNIDGIPNEARMPILFGYVKNNYRFLANIHGNELWIREGKRGHH